MTTQYENMHYKDCTSLEYLQNECIENIKDIIYKNNDVSLDSNSKINVIKFILESFIDVKNKCNIKAHNFEHHFVNYNNRKSL